ncbi:hypothetical protein MNBD_DELTA01-1276 [hydrothermal vent metagenome]|uniref:Lipoprotein n=1 Tax=hydrothermal vent metagenome TaxID=652676 RepID=A0A3B0R315_9ZZZZ
MKKISIFFILVIFAIIAGCAHPVEFRTPVEESYNETLPCKAALHMDEDLQNKVYSSRSFGSGIANRWDVPIGKIVYDYADSNLKKGFDGFYKVDSLSGVKQGDIAINIADIDYYMKGQAAHANIVIDVNDSKGNKAFSKEYSSDGPSGFGRVMLGGAFAQKSAIRQSTDVVLKDIFKSFMADYAGSEDMCR